jgi:hypothetical protein
MDRAWAPKGRAEAEDEGRGEDIVQVVLSWRDGDSGTVLSLREVRAGQTLSLGEDGDLLLPTAVLGAARVEVLRYREKVAVAQIPEGATVRVDGCHLAPLDPRLAAGEVKIAPGHIVEILLGAFVLRMARVRPLRRPSASPFDSVRGAGAGVLFGSVLAYAAAFAFVALLAPSLGAEEEDADDRDRIALIQRLLAAGDAMPRPIEVSSQDAETAGGTSWASAARPEQGIGRNARSPGPMPTLGEAPPSHGTPSVEAPNGRAQLLSEAGGFGAIGLLQSFELGRLTGTWGRTVDGDPLGEIWGDTLSDSFSTSDVGLGSLGTKANGIAWTGFGALDSGCAACVGAWSRTSFTVTSSDPAYRGEGEGYPGGFGRGIGGLHRVRGPRIHDPWEGVGVNGRLPPEVIQRVIRQNSGRYRFCYENGLRTNPTLAGRVTVKFAIGRHGEVAVATDGGSDLPDATVRQCVVSSFATLSFPEPEGGTVMVEYPLVFDPPEPEEAEPLFQR